MNNLLQHLQPWHWALLGIVLVTLEIFAPGIYLLWLGLAAGTVAGLLWLWPALTWPWQLLAFGALALVSVLVGRRLAARTASDEPHLNRRADRYLGRVVTLAEAITNGQGKVYLDDTLWKVYGPELPAGTKVRIVGADGVVLQVESTEAPEPK